MFRKYNSIENTYREEFLERIKSHGFWNDEFVVQEKVHGANCVQGGFAPRFIEV